MSFLRPIGELFLVTESVFVGCKVVFHGPDDLSFTTQAKRLLMFCVRYLDMNWIQGDRPMKLSTRLFLLLSTLIVVMLLGYKKYSQNAHRNISHGTIKEITTILSFSAALGATFNYKPTVIEFFWAFSRFIDVVVEVPQLKLVYASDRLHEWIIAYYYCIGSHVFFYILDMIYRIKQEDFYDIISGCTTISKGAVIAVFFAARFFNQREGRPASGQEEPLLGSDAQVNQRVDNKSPANVADGAV